MNEPIRAPRTPGGSPNPGRPELSRDQIIRRFVEHWGMMARAWGINATMGELFAVLYITGTEWTADDLREWLQVSRGNVSMNLRELMSWGVILKIHRAGERREFFRAEADVSTLFRRILLERKRRELDPTLLVLERTVSLLPAEPAEHLLRERLSTLLRFFSLIDRLATRVVTLEPHDLEELRQLFEETNPAPIL
jgi:HTH-type transcriptional regulator, glycine betaine synthesis regulator